MTRPKIALMIDWYLPGTKAGGPVRSVYSMINALKDEYEFYVITSNCDLGSNEPYEGVTENVLFVKENIFYYYFNKKNLNNIEILKLFEKIKPDLIYLNSFWSYNFSIVIVRLKNRNLLSAPLLLAPRGMLGKGALSLKSTKKKAFLFFAKVLGWYKTITFQATQNQEAQDIYLKFRKNKIVIAPNLNAGILVKNNSFKAKGKLKLFYLSRIARVKNLEFALTVLSKINIEIEYNIYGNLEDKSYWNDCQKVIESLPLNISVKYKGELNFSEVQSTISQNHALFLPTLNENFGHAIVESLLCGCPVIISDQTPWNDVQENGAGFAISLEDETKFLTALYSLAELNQEQFSVMSKRANKYISEKIDISKIKEQYRNMFDECIKN